MSAYCDTSTHYIGGTITGPAANAGRILLDGLFWIDGSLTLGSTNCLVEISSVSGGAATSAMRISLNASRVLSNVLNGVSAVGTGSNLAVANGWNYFWASYGPFDGASQTARIGLNGVTASNPATKTSDSTNLNFIRYGNVLAGGSSHARSYLYGCTLLTGLTTTQEDAYVAARLNSVRTGADGTTTASSTTFGGSGFSAPEALQDILIGKAGASAADLATTIASYTSATSVELAVAASTAIAGTAAYNIGRYKAMDDPTLPSPPYRGWKFLADANAAIGAENLTPNTGTTFSPTRNPLFAAIGGATIWGSFIIV